MLGPMLGALAVAAALASEPQQPARAHETGAERLYRKGVHCMEVIERTKCAISNFEKLMEEPTDQRELVTDAMLRLVKLYQQTGREQDIPPITRKFWDVGIKRRSRGHVPYTTRFLPREMDMLLMINVQGIANAPISKRLGQDMVDLLFTCSGVRRQEINERRRWRRAEKLAREQDKTTITVIYEQQDEARKQREEWKQRQGRGKGKTGNDTVRKEYAAPLFSKALCPVMVALGHDDALTVTRGIGAMNHADFRKSIAVLHIEGLEGLLATATSAGRLQPAGDRRWVLPDFEYNENSVHLARLDRDELVIATTRYMDGMVSARATNKRRINRSLDQLVGKIPRDGEFFLVMTETALKAMVTQDMNKTQRGLMEALFPRPRGLQVAGVFQEYFGMFVRMPTDTPTKGRMLVNVARMVIDAEAEDDAEAAMFLKNLDLAESSDRKALLMSYVVSPSELKAFLDP